MAKNSRKKEETKSLQDKAISLRADGLTYEEISREMDIDVQEAIDLISEKEEKIKTLQGVKMESYFKERKARQRDRIKELSNLRQRLSDELSRRDLTDIPTDKLITLLIKTNGIIKGEVYNPLILSSERQAKAAKDRTMWDNI